MILQKYFSLLSCLAAICLLESSNGHPRQVSDVPNKLFYIMIDAFRYDYLDMQPSKNLPGFTKFLKEGVKADWMTPIFPSVSYPDWTTMVTGLWAESHGVVGNYMYNPANQDEFILGKENTTGAPQWWSAEPIWTTATKAGLKSGIIRFSRCEIPYDGVVPEHCDPFDYTEQDRDSFTNNTEKALTLLENGYDLVILYTPYIDTVGHYSGPETDEMLEAVRFIDKHILHIQTELEARSLDDKVNIVIVSDHGMKDVFVGAAIHIELANYINSAQIEEVIDYGAFSNIKTQPGAIQQVYNDLKKITGIDVYLKEETPTRYHYSNHDLIHDILIVARDGYYIQGLKDGKQIPTRSDSPELIGAHGFDPLEEKMRAIFFAKGPDFETHKIIPAIQNVDVYPLLARLLNIDPLPNNGSILHVQESLKYNKRSNVSVRNVFDDFMAYVRNRGKLVT